MPGPFYFAWIEAPEAFNPDYHAIEDEHIFEFTVTHAEGEIPTLQLDIINPRVGLLSRPVWAWLSWDKNWVQAETHTPDIVPLFLGRLIGIPNSFNKEIITLDFVARPPDYAGQREAIAESMRELPFYDPVWISPDLWNDPDVVLEGYTRLWHFDRITHTVTTSDIVTGEEGVAEFQEAMIPYESVAMGLSAAPFRSVHVDAAVKWTQRATGGVNIVKDFVVTALNGKAIMGSWPKDGASLGGGYFAASASAIDLRGTDDVELISFSSSWNSTKEKHAPGDTLSTSYSSNLPPLYYQKIPIPIPFPPPQTFQNHSGIGKASFNATYLFVLSYSVKCNLRIGYEAERGRTEVANFMVNSNLQPVLSDPTSVDAHELRLTSNDVDVEVFGGEIPIGDVGRKSYFETDRGQQSLQYLMCLARAKLTSAARCIDVSCTIPFAEAIELSCRKNAIIHDRRLPGGEALGKVTEYTFTCTGRGEMSGTVKIASTIGYGDAIDEVEGEPVYVDEGYVDPGYQFYDGATVVLPGGNLAYDLPEFAGEDDGIVFPLTKKQIVVSETWHNLDQQQDFTQTTHNPGEGGTISPSLGRILTATNQDEVNEYVKGNPVYYELVLKNINGKFTSPYNVVVVPLELPKQIDLEFSDV